MISPEGSCVHHYRSEYALCFPPKLVNIDVLWMLFLKKRLTYMPLCTANYTMLQLGGSSKFSGFKGYTIHVCMLYLYSNIPNIPLYTYKVSSLILTGVKINAFCIGRVPMIKVAYYYA